MSIPVRKRFELQQKLDSLTSELEHWRSQSEKGQPFEKHHSQIRLASAQLDGERERLATDLKKVTASSDETAVLSNCRAIENAILELHSVWDYFRRKLMLRRMDSFREYLYAADELAWACYEPPQRNVTSIAREDVREPPLVFFSGAASPLTASRRQRYCEQALPGEAEISLGLIEIVDSLPIPVISVPWFQIQHLPDALVITHEVGHNVEFDFKLTDTLQAAITASGVPDEHLENWCTWGSETFADYYGTLAAGPAFVETLMDFLADDPDVVTGEYVDPDSTYPPGWLRIELCLSAIQKRGFQNEADRIREQWMEYFPNREDEQYESDAPKIVAALDNLEPDQFGGVRFSDIISFHVDDQEAANSAAGLLQKKRFDRLTDYNVRTLLVAARIAFSADSEQFVSDQLGKEILGKIPQKPGTRMRYINNASQLKKAEDRARNRGVRLTGRRSDD